MAIAKAKASGKRGAKARAVAKAASKASKSGTKSKRPAKRSNKGGKREPIAVAVLTRELDKLYPDAHCELDFKNPFELLVATILSAQCTDKRVNMVTPALFARFPDAASLAMADSAEVEELIRTTGFFRNKTKNILGAAQVLTDEFGGVVPQTMDELLRLPGVARKTANVLLGSAFGKNEGFVVDTHIGRLANRLGLTKETDPVKVERDLCEQVPRERWTLLGHQLIWHGRRVCSALRPQCHECALAPGCPSFGVV